MGPGINQAYDMNGSPTKAALGFAKSLGVELERVEKKDSEKGPRLYYRSVQPGGATIELLKSLLPELILSLKFPKSMRWGSGKIRFARPIHWILAIFGGEVVDFAMDVIRSGNKTFGHRFLAPGAIEVKNFEGYERSLRKAFVIVDPAEREKMIKDGLAKRAQELGVEIYPDPGLIGEVDYLVEYPVVLAGEFSPKFLEIPAEVLIAAMRGHQRYFALKEKGKGLKLTPHFLFAANTHTDDDQVVVKGNQKVLSARLTDAEFFWREDLKISIAERAEHLDQMVFQTGLGTYKDKCIRLEKLISELMREANRSDSEQKRNALRAVKLCKADLLTQMVGEFPELEGIMSGEYARKQGEPEEVWKAIREHYLPKTAEDIEQGRFPETRLGEILSMVDKIDSVAAGFVNGHQPTGSQDPYGIRRMANAIIYTSLQIELDFNLDNLLKLACGLLSEMLKKKLNDSLNEILDFYKIKIKNILIDQKIEYDIANAVIGAWDGSLISVSKRAHALSELRREPGFEDLFVGFRRVARIIEHTGTLDASLFEYSEEKALWEAFLSMKVNIETLLKEREMEGSNARTGQTKAFYRSFF